MTTATMPPLISVVIYGPIEQSPLAQAIESVGTQGIEHLELLIGDNNIAAAQGEYIAFLATTDLFEPGTLKARLNYLLSNPDTDLIHSPVKLIDLDGKDLGAVITRPKAITFDAAINPIHLSGVMGKTQLFRGLSLSQDPALGWYQGWLLFAQVLSTGVTSEYVEHGGAQHRVCQTPTLELELQRHQAALDVVLGWIYAPSHAVITKPRYRFPPLTVAKRLRELSLFIWCLISGNAHVCRSMMKNSGLVAFLNTWLVKSLRDEIYLQLAYHYQVNLRSQPEQLAQETKATIVQHAMVLGLRERAPSLLLALCECFDIPYPQEPATILADFNDMATASVHTPSPWVLITSFRTHGAADEVQNCAQILLDNCGTAGIDQVHVLLEGPPSILENLLAPAQVQALHTYQESGKLIFSPISSRPDYKTLFDYANTLGHVSAAIANADMRLPETAVRQMNAGRVADGNPIYALTRWNHTKTGDFLQGMQAHPPWPQWPPDARHYFEKHCLSYDCYVFDTPISVPPELASVSMATYGCDTAIAAMLRTEGYQVHNPCLSIQTLHLDEKMRDYAGTQGQQDLSNNVASFGLAIMRRYAQHPIYAHSLQQLSILEKQTAWLGGPGNSDVMHTIFLNLGATPWTKQGNYPPFSSIHITIQDGNLDTAEEALANIPAAIERNLFIFWELNGFPQGGHIADLLVNHPRFEAIGYPLFGYQRQSVLHQDIASKNAQIVLRNLYQMISELLLG
ncbi:hypothetical protein ACIKP9_10445 [Methylobacillus methanolivorans]|uniref:Uncharacterized protein n=1 Tax=Methylobacillus methanolivorans TaxID=1848927 RepID=A0ABW8GRK1_9PROT